MPSIILVTIAHHYKTEHSIEALVMHVSVACLLTFMALSSFIVCVARDPGPVAPLKSRETDTEHDTLDDDDELSLADALAGPSIKHAESSDEDSDIEVDDQGEKRWCRKCWAPKVGYMFTILILHISFILMRTKTFIISQNELITAHIVNAVY